MFGVGTQFGRLGARRSAGGATWRHVQVYGQSLGVGTTPSGGVALTTSPATANAYMLTTNNGSGSYGPRVNLDDTGTGTTPAAVDRYLNTNRIPGLELLHEAATQMLTDASVKGSETICSGYAAQFMASPDSTLRVVMDVCARGSAPWRFPAGAFNYGAGVDLAPGAYHFTNCFMAQDLVRKYVEAAKGTYLWSGLIMVHGEADAAGFTGPNSTTFPATTYSAYVADLVECVTAFNTQARTRSRFHRDRRMYVSQLSSIAYVQNGGTTGTAGFNIARAQADAPASDSRIVCVGPKYDIAYDTDNLHLTGASYRLLGERIGMWARRIEREGKAFTAFKPTAATLVGSTVTMPFNVPWGLNMALDTTLVAAAADARYGLKYYDNASSGITISAVSLGADLKSLVVTLSGAPSLANSPYITIADQSTAAANTRSGPTQGARSNIRTTETEVGKLSGSILYDWACHSQTAITA